MLKMFRLLFAKTFDFGIMQKHKLSHIIEDFYVAKENVFCIADGVTRERLDGKVFSYPLTLEEAIDINNNYPNPSGASKAAQIVVNTFVSEIQKLEIFNEKAIMNCVKHANEELKILNSGRKIDYGIEDYYSCVSVGGVIENDMLYCFSIGDCKIRILDDEYNVLFDTTQSDINSSDEVIKKPCEYDNIDDANWNWNNIEYRKYYRKEYRNNAIRKQNNLPCFGVLTGEDQALEFVNTYIVPINEKARYILAYSDGCDNFMNAKEDRKAVINNPDILKEEKHEKTLIIYEKI